MEHPIHHVTAFEARGEFVLVVHFDDGVKRTIDFEPVLRGELYGPLVQPEVFARVRVDEEAGTLVWPNGADFDPSILHDWPQRGPALVELAATWQTPALR